jgi:hypothetical protein
MLFHQPASAGFFMRYRFAVTASLIPDSAPSGNKTTKTAEVTLSPYKSMVWR